MNYKFLFVSLDALSLDIAWQIVREGHQAKMFIDHNASTDIGDGMVEKVTDWKSEIDWADVIIFDDTLGQGIKADRLRRAGKAVIGGTPYTDRLEDDRGFGQEELKRHGVPILTYQVFADFDEAITYVREHPGRYVFKPSGDAAKRLLFVGDEEDGSDVINILEAYKRVWSKKIKSFQLQKRVTGVEVAVGAFFNGSRFITPININFEHKKLFPGNLGISTGEMGTSMFWTDPNRLFNSTLKKFEETLSRDGYVGYIDINCIVNGNGIYPLEFTSRFGYPTISIQHEGLNMPMWEFMYRLANRESFTLKTKKGFQVGVRLRLPPYPFDDKKAFETYTKDATIFFKRKVLDGIHPEDVKIVDDQWKVAGDTGAFMTVAGTGPTMRDAQQQAYNRVQNIMVPNMYYRDDIGDRWTRDSDLLHTWGYLREV